MKFGYLSVNTANGMHPGTLGRELEERGFESLWVPEHSHIPVNSVNLFPAGELPDGYAHAMNPFLSLIAAASHTERLKLGTGICLPLEHDLMDLACTTGTLDALSDGRFILGVGVGWNNEELGNHRPELPFKQRYSALEERIAALRSAWSREAVPYDGHFAEHDWGGQISSFQGRFDRYTSSWIFPKPESGTIPVAMGLTGPLGMKHAARYGDAWLPVDIALVNQGKMDVPGRIEHFRQVVADAGRDPADVPITLFVWSELSDEIVERYHSLGIERLVLAPPSFTTHGESETLRRLDGFNHYVERFASP